MEGIPGKGTCVTSPLFFPPFSIYLPQNRKLGKTSQALLKTMQDSGEQMPCVSACHDLWVPEIPSLTGSPGSGTPS